MQMNRYIVQSLQKTYDTCKYMKSAIASSLYVPIMSIFKKDAESIVGPAVQIALFVQRE